MAETNYNVKILVDVQGKKVMDALATGSGAGSGSTKSGNKSLIGAVGAAKEKFMSGEGIGTVFSTLTKSMTGLAAVVGIGVGVLLMAVGNSKILSTIFGTIGKLLGFLMDIILLPMMPIFMFLVRYLYMMIIAFRNFTKNLSLKSLLEFGLLINPLTMPISWVVKLLQWALGEGNLQTAINFAIGVLQGAGDWLWDVAKWLFFGTIRIVNSAINLTLSIGSAITGALVGIASLGITLLKFLFGLTSPLNTSLTLNFVANLVGTAWNVLKSIANSGVSVLNMGLSALGLPKLDSGGTVMQTGVAVVHRGETYSGVTGSGQPASSPGGGNTYQFYNYGNTKNEYDLFLKFMDLMRQRGKGLTL